MSGFPYYKQLDSMDCGPSGLRKEAKGGELRAQGSGHRAQSTEFWSQILLRVSFHTPNQNFLNAGTALKAKVFRRVKLIGDIMQRIGDHLAGERIAFYLRDHWPLKFIF